MNESEHYACNVIRPAVRKKRAVSGERCDGEDRGICEAPLGRRRPIFLLLTAHHDAERIIRQRPLQRLRFIPGRARIQTSRSSSVVRIKGIVFG